MLSELSHADQNGLYRIDSPLRDIFYRQREKVGFLCTTAF